MHAELKAHVAFHLTGRRPAADLDAVESLNLRPALLARYRDLASLRYDYPLVLVHGATGAAAIRTLTTIMNGVLREIAPQGVEGEQLRKHVLHLEREIRAQIAAGACGRLSALWTAAATRLAANDASIRESLERARAVLDFDGDVLDCQAATPALVLQRAWQDTHEIKADAFRKNVNRLIQKLSDILRSDFLRSDAGQSADSLKEAIGTAHAEVFDFAAMSRVLGKSLPHSPLPQGRRARIEWALTALKSQRFFDLPERHAGKTHTFVFDSCAGALKAYRERVPELVELAKAFAIAELEIDGLYVDAQHDPFFRDYGEDLLDAADIAVFPDYLVRVHAERLPPAEHERLDEIMSSQLPMKVLLQVDDLLDGAPGVGARPAFNTRVLRFGHSAMQANEAYVLQAAASHLYPFRGRIVDGMNYRGPALFSVYTGAAGRPGGLPPYLAAAAAMTSRAFPAYVYDPSAGANLAVRFHIDDNPDADRDWPVHAFAYEDEDHQSVRTDLAFTFVDWLACDPRGAVHFARVPPAQWDDRMVAAAECLDRNGKTTGDAIPYLLVVDAENCLHKVIVDGKLLKEARRCGEAWHSLQEMGGIHNSHARRLLERERQAWQEQQQAAALHAPAPAAAAPAAAMSSAAPAAQALVEEKRSDDPYIETARCSSCNECIQLNGTMFAYDGNKQAYIANPDAGSYRELVEAAESCQVSVIHPGKPRDPNEPGLEELMARAEPFL